MRTHSCLGVDGLPTTLTRMCLVGGASYSGGLCWVDWTSHLTVVGTKGGLGAGVQGGGRAEGESQRSEAKMRWTSRVGW